MPISLPREIKALMTQTVAWESFQGWNGYAEPTYAIPVDLNCWIEEHSLLRGGVTAYRNPDGTVTEPVYDLYFNGDDSNARLIQLYDRFTISTTGFESTQKLQAARVNTFLGPDFDDRNPWLIIVTL